MFIGHFGVALAAKKAAPRTSLGTLVLAAQFLDLLWPIFLLSGLEHVKIAPGITPLSPLAFTDYPYSHSLLMALLWAVLLGGVYYGIRRDRASAGVVAACVFSHWVLDFVTHIPDLQLLPGGVARVGLGLWKHPAASIVVEASIFLAGVLLYAKTTRTQDAIGRYGFWSWAVFLPLGWTAAMLGGAPLSVAAVAWGALSMWLMVPWAWWADRHRTLRNVAA